MDVSKIERVCIDERSIIMNKTLKRNIFGLAACVYMMWSPTCLGYKWITHENNKSHIFCNENGKENQNEIVDITQGWILDEGFRWKKSLDFTILKGYVKDSNTGKKFCSDDLHKILSEKVKEAGEGHGCAGALTIVKKLTAGTNTSQATEDIDQFEACTYILDDKVAIPYHMKEETYTSAAGKHRISAFTHQSANDLLKRVMKLIDHQEKEYNCCEGQMLGYFIAGTDESESSFLERILERHWGDDVVLIVLHLHTKFDPCGKCSRIISSVSDWMNKNGPNTTNKKLKLTEKFDEPTGLSKWCQENKEANICYQIAFHSWRNKNSKGDKYIYSKKEKNNAKYGVKQLMEKISNIRLPENQKNTKFGSLIERVIQKLYEINEKERLQTDREYNLLKVGHMLKLLTIILDDNVKDLEADNKKNFCDYLYNRIRACFTFNYKTLIEVSCNQVYAIKKHMRNRVEYCLRKCSPKNFAIYKNIFGSGINDQKTAKSLMNDISGIHEKTITLTNFPTDKEYILEELNQMLIEAGPDANGYPSKLTKCACLIRAYRVLAESKEDQGVRKEWLTEACRYLVNWIEYELDKVKDDSTVYSWPERVDSHCRDCGTGSESVPIIVKLDDDEKINSQDHENNANSVELGFKKQPARSNSQSEQTSLIFEKSYPPYAIYSVIETNEKYEQGEYWPAKGGDRLEKF